jgi:hypothetical protein
MEDNVQTSKFRFKKYQVVKSSIDFNDDKTLEREYAMHITPSGKKIGKDFKLKLEINIEDKNEAYKAYVAMIGDFEFTYFCFPVYPVF